MSSAPAASSPRAALPPRPVRPPRPGHAPRARVAVTPRPRPALQRDRECVATGVSAGLARHLGAPVSVVRALFVVLSLLAGAGVLLYLWCWAFMPWMPGAQAPTRRAPIAWILIAAAVAGFAFALAALAEYESWGWAPSLRARLIGGYTVAVLSSIAAGLWAGVVDRADPARGPRHALWVRSAAVLILLVALVRAVYAGGSGLDVLLSIAIPLLGIIVVLSAGLIERWRDLTGERDKRIREEQRAEMAAHLHDSVLQTLALIQNRAGASSEAARLARAQERELRAWLYDGDAPADSDLPTDLRDYAGGLELDYPVRIDVVSAGLSAERASGEVAAAAREAMLNAARHAGGDVSVYIEGGDHGVDVYIRDRGAGFSPDAVGEHRLGIRESIVGRMRRVGGSATVRSNESGTEVHLHYRDGDGRG